MEPLFFNTQIVTLSAPSPTIGTALTSFESRTVIQGNTQIILDYAKTSFNVPAYKVKLSWNHAGESVTQIANTNLNPLSTITPFNSAATTFVFVPITTMAASSSTFLIYYENGVVYKFIVEFTVLAGNAIDLNLNVLDAQIGANGAANVFNLESVAKNITFSNVKY